MRNMAKKIQTNWDLTQFYSSITDPQLLKDVAAMKRAHTAFAKKYRNRRDYLTSETKLFAALKDYEKLEDKPFSRPLVYLSYRTSLDAGDKEAQSLLSKLSQEYTEYDNQILFFRLQLGTITKTNQKKFLKSATLKPFRYLLEQIFEFAKYDLSESEEKILSKTAFPSSILWVRGVSQLHAQQEVPFKGKNIPISEVYNTIADLPTTDRRALHKKSMEVIRDNVSDFAESEINAVYTNKKIRDELRGFEKPYTAKILGNENTEEEVMNLVDVVTDNFNIAHRFYRLKKKLLGLEQLYYADRNAQIGKIKTKFTFNETMKTLRSEFYGFGDVYGKILDDFLAGGQIDVFPKKGKSGGAFCSSSTKSPTMVLLNHVDNLNSATTFAHEMGHAIHFELSKNQPPFYQGASLSVAETASTFFENLIFQRLFEELSEKEKIIALHDKISSSISTVFRQIACFNFELELHQAIREKGMLSKEEITRLLNKHMRSYLGSAIKVEDLDGYFFISWSHIRRFFYVYTYAYGELVSQALFARYQEDRGFEENVRHFLSAGCSKRPNEIFKDIGIDITNPKFFAQGLKNIEADIARLEKLTKK